MKLVTVLAVICVIMLAIIGISIILNPLGTPGDQLYSAPAETEGSTGMTDINDQVDTSVPEEDASSVVYVSTEGDDDGSGDREHPFRTIDRAVQSGAETVYVFAGVYKEPITASRPGGVLELLAKPLSDTQKDVVIDLSIDLEFTEDEDTGLSKTSYHSEPDDMMYLMFVSRAEELYVQDQFISDGYRCNLWDGDMKLVPVLSLEECCSTEGTWFYDGSFIYANASPGRFQLSDGAYEYGIHLSWFKEVKLVGISVRYAQKDAVRLQGCAEAQISRCSFSHSGMYCGLALESTSAVVRNCEAMYCRTDGFNIHGVSTVDIIDCVAHHNQDDGVSHHDQSGGMVIGGAFYDNTKAGIASPTFGSRNSISGAYIHHNGVGVYAVTTEDGNYPVCTVSNCAIVSNGVGIRSCRYDLECWNMVLVDNQTDLQEDDGGSIHIIGP